MPVIALAQLLVLLDTATFNMAVPAVQADLGLPSHGLASMFRAYALAFGGVLLLGGYVADLVGRKLVFVIGLAGCAAASALAGSAGDSGLLVWARGLQGLSGALLTASALALVATGFTDPKERGRAFGIYAAITGGGSALGLLTGGWLIESLSWRVSLYASVLLAVIALISAFPLVHDRLGTTGARFDGLGLLLGTGALATLTYGLTEVDALGWTAPLVLVLFAVGVALFVTFLWWQTRTAGRHPSPYGVAGRDRVGCVLVMLLAGVAVLASFPSMTFYLQSVLGYTPAMTGVALLPMVAAVVIGSTQLSARLQHRFAPRVLIAAGLVTAALGLVLLTGLTVDGANVVQVLPGMLLMGLGIGVAFMPVLAVATAVAPQHSGAASATVTVAQYVGGVLGSVLLSSIVVTRLRNSAWPSGPAGEALLGGYTTTLWWAVGSMLLAGLLAGLLVTAKTPEDDVPAVHPAVR
ncbi:MFS transporter [Streptomyces sp. NBC_00190]|nr:MFS transporter [Streptomyces sp. NBC_00868]